MQGFAGVRASVRTSEKRSRWLGTLFGGVVGLGFLVSPVVISLGVGYFGLEFSLGFPATVLFAHVAFGAVLGFLAHRFSGAQSSLVFANLRSVLVASPLLHRPYRGGELRGCKKSTSPDTHYREGDHGETQNVQLEAPPPHCWNDRRRPSAVAVACLCATGFLAVADFDVACWLVRAGLVYTHVFEYAYHRWLMHGGLRFLSFIRKNHLAHHRVFYGEQFDTRDPHALEHVTGQWFLFPIAFLAHFLVLHPLLGAAELSSFLGGIVSHYLVFEVTHWFAHVADNDFDWVVRRVPLLGWMREMQLRHHRLHHEIPEMDFNFVPPFAMDFLGATFLAPGDCTEASKGPCFFPGTMRLRTPFDRRMKQTWPFLRSLIGGHDRPDSVEERNPP